MPKSEEYWRKREEEQRKKNIEDEEEYVERIKYYYRQEMNAIEDRIYAFYVRYSTKEGITMAEARRRVSKMDVEEFAEMAAKYVKEKDFSERANEELRLYNLTMRVNYQQLLMYQIAMESCATADELEQFMKSKLEGRTIDEIERQAGILGESLLDQKEMVGSIVNASFHNATFSDRIWANQALLRSNLSNILTNALIQGRNPRDYVKQIRRAFDVSRGQAERLLRTELARVQSEAQLKSYEKAEFDGYIFHALGDACPVCAALDGEHFKVKDAEPGINISPMHPNCRCSTGPYMDTTDFDEWLDGIDDHGLTWSDWKRRATNRINIQASSTESYKKSLKSIVSGKAGLDKRRTNILNRVPETGDFVELERDTISDRDMAYLSAAAGHEFALFRGKHSDILIHGDHKSCNPQSKDLEDQLLSGKYEWVSHTHVSGSLMPSQGDRDTLILLHQKESLIIGVDGSVRKFSQSVFDD